MKASKWGLFIGASLVILLAMSYKIIRNNNEMDVTHKKFNAAKKAFHFTFNQVEKNVKPIQTRNISIPEPLHPVNDILNYTAYIGTSEHPTIDGGIINTTEAKIVDRNLPKENLPVKAPEKITAPKEKWFVKSENTFGDDWATDKKIRQFLIAATNQNKLDYVLQKTKEMGLPASIAVVPMVESNYKINAVSQKGAGGAWQLMPITAKKYGVDNLARFEFKGSTDAALKHLTILHNEFGNWELAFAAYNAGSKRVNDAIHKNPNAKEVNDLDLPEETKQYVAKIKELNKAMVDI